MKMIVLDHLFGTDNFVQLYVSLWVSNLLSDVMIILKRGYAQNPTPFYSEFYTVLGHLLIQKN